MQKRLNTNQCRIMPERKNRSNAVQTRLKVRKGLKDTQAATSGARARAERGGGVMRAAVCAQQRRGESLGAVAGGGGARRE